ncbi:MAG: NPCBM/NEW2 domain-containing protein, partial [Planctomycetota bacterium]
MTRRRHPAATRTPLLLSAAIAVVVPGVAASAELLLVDGTTADAEFAAADQTAVQWSSDSGPTSTAWKDLFRWGAPAAQPPRPRVVLRDGSELVAGPPWTRNGAVQWADDTLWLQSITLAPLKLPRAAVDHLLLEAARDPAVAIDLAPASDRQSDRLHLMSGDVIDGRLVSIKAGTVVFRVGDEPIEIDVGRVAAAELAPDTPRTNSSTSGVVVGLADGSLLRADPKGRQSGGVVPTTVAGVRAVVNKASAVLFLQQLSGEFVYLSDVEPLDYRHTPYAGVAWGYARDRGLDGRPIRVGGRRFLKGVAMHSPSRLVYRLTPGGRRRFDFEMAIADSAGTPVDG